MNSTHKFQTRSGRKLTLWGLVAALVLLLAVGSAGAKETGGRGAGVQGSKGAWERGSTGAGEQGFERANVSLANMSLADAQPATLQSSTARTVTYTYDANGRLSVANYGQGKLLVYHYDPAGNLVRVTDHYDAYLPLVLRH